MIENILNRLDKVKPSGSNKWLACCPGHDDRSPSLSIRDTGEKILFHCFAGCDTSDVLAAIGLSWQDILPPMDKQDCSTYVRMKSSKELKKLMLHESVILAIKPSNHEDFERQSLAEKRIKKIQAVLHG